MRFEICPSLAGYMHISITVICFFIFCQIQDGQNSFT